MRNPVIFISLLFCQPIFAQLNCGGRYLTQVFNSASQQLISYDSAVAWDNSQVELQMLVFTPDSDSLTQRPAVMVMHGGSFTSGNLYSTQVLNLCGQLAMRGYVTVSVGYRLGIAPWTNSVDYVINYYHTIYRAAQDAKSAVRFLKSTATTYGIDTSLIFIGGYSAGAANALSEAFWQQHEVIPIINTPVWGTFEENGTYSNRVAGVFGIGGAMEDTTLIENDILPAALVHGVTDPIVPFTSGADASGVTIYGSNAVQMYLQTHNGFSFLKSINQPGFHTPAAGSALEDTVNEFLTNSLFSILGHLSQPAMSFRYDTITASDGGAYKWFLNGSVVNNQALPQLVIQQSGYYQVEIIYENGCSYLSDSVFYNKLIEIRDTVTTINFITIADTALEVDTVVVLQSGITDTTVVTSSIVECDSTILEGSTIFTTDSTFQDDTLIIAVTFSRNDTHFINCQHLVKDSIFIPDGSTGIDAIFENSIVVYPNPNNGSLTISLNEDWTMKNARIKLYGLSGNEVFNSSLINNRLFMVLPSSIQPGFFLLELKSDFLFARKKLLIY